jgi:beta-galactosidase
MKTVQKTLLFAALLFIFVAHSGAARAVERRVLFDEGWRFYRGSVANAEVPEYNDSRWRTVDLPHDWSVEPAPIQREGITVGPFSRMSEGGMGGADTGQTLGGEGWYRKSFTLSGEDTAGRVALYFEGVANQSEVWVNGRKAHYNPYAYTSYRVDITGLCRPAGEVNTVVVRALNTGENSRWYVGSGIFRHVWLIRTADVRLDEWDTYFDASRVEGRQASVDFSTVVHSDEATAREAEVAVRVFAPSGEQVAAFTRTVALPGRETPVTATFPIRNPQLWSLENPRLHTAEVTVSTGGVVRDRVTVPFGVRTISFSADKGFQLNGKTIKLKGGCLHHDNGLLGAAAFDRAEQRKVELMLANGYNAVRCAHNQVSEAFLDACDRLGMLVIHETFDQWQQSKRGNDYSQFFDQWSDRDLAASVRRDRNHPSIIMWSIGNEVAQRADIPQGDLISKRLVATIRKYDTSSRATTIAANDFWDRRDFKWDVDSHRAFQNLDVAGYNYLWQKYESDHAAWPARVIYGSESFPKEAAANWNLVEKHPYVIGDFVWTSIDYLGEAGLGRAMELVPGERTSQWMGWPWYNAWCGDIDFIGDKKPQSYYRDILWRQREITMAVRPPVAEGRREVVNGWGWTDELLSWNWPGREGQPMRVNVYSRAPRVRLYRDGAVVGESEVDPETYTATFEVAYSPGALKAVNLDARRREGASVTLETTGAPAAIRLTADRADVRADRNDLAYVTVEIVDAQGRTVSDASVRVTLAAVGNGRIIASGNGAYADVESFRSLTPTTFRGKAGVVIQPTAEPGDITLTVSAEGVPETTLTIATR